MKDKHNLQGLNWFEDGHSRVLFYFSTSWCAPCKNMALIMDEVSIQYADQLKMINIDVDEQMQLAKQFDVKGVPTLVLLDALGAKTRLIGGASSSQVKEWLDLQLNRLLEQ